ncbi:MULTISPECIES: hypothetical protein [Saccharibacillus]|nr:hypothetical protein [Saccharibacillus sp. WB 17]MWJ30572.1 hypothetical protein [Saccharibacillus sp. WB 17]
MRKRWGMLFAVGVLSVVMGCGADNGDDDMDSNMENHDMNDMDDNNDGND